MRWLSYLLLTLRRFVSYRSSKPFIEWKFGFLVLLLETTVAFCIVWAAFEDALESVNRYVLLAAIVVPFVVLNEYLLDKRRFAKYEQGFVALPRARRIALNIAAVALIAGIFALPFIVRTVKTGQSWWE
jgi:ABC-type molybdate transport system permease subunit